MCSEANLNISIQGAIFVGRFVGAIIYLLILSFQNIAVILSLLLTVGTTLQLYPALLPTDIPVSQTLLHKQSDSFVTLLQCSAAVAARWGI